MNKRYDVIDFEELLMDCTKFVFVVGVIGLAFYVLTIYKIPYWLTVICVALLVGAIINTLAHALFTVASVVAGLTVIYLNYTIDFMDYDPDDPDNSDKNIKNGTDCFRDLDDYEEK